MVTKGKGDYILFLIIFSDVLLVYERVLHNYCIIIETIQAVKYIYFEFNIEMTPASK